MLSIPTPMKDPSHPIPVCSTKRLRYFTYRERASINHIQQLKGICSRLQLPKQTTERACIVFSRAYPSEFHQTLSLYPHVLMIAAIHRATIEHRIGISEQRIIQVLNPGQHVSIRLLHKADFAIIDRWGPILEDPRSVLFSYISQLHIEGNSRAELIKQTLVLLEDQKSSGHRPSVIIAAAFWLVGRQLHLGILQKELVAISGRSFVAIRNMAHAMSKEAD